MPSMREVDRAGRQPARFDVMRWLALIAMVGFGCTRDNAAFGDGGGTGEGTGVSAEGAEQSSVDASAEGVSVDETRGEASDGPSTLDEGEESVGEEGTTGAVHSCCEESPEPGCRDDVIEGCVCNAKPLCCEDKWSLTCVNAAIACGASCEVAETGGETGGESTGASEETTTEGGASESTGENPASPCCVPADAIGCDADVEIEMCVCEMDAACCKDAWEGVCVDLADLCGGNCL